MSEIPEPPRCPRCAEANPTASRFCNRCGASLLGAETVAVAAPLPTPTVPARGAGMPPTYLGWAVAALLLFWPMGIPALVCATRVESRFYAGDYVGSRTASDGALTCSIIAFIPGGLFLLWVLASAVAYSTR